MERSHRPQENQHAGCMLNELADERAGRGYAAEGPPLCPGPQKYGSLWLRIRQSLQTKADSKLRPVVADAVSIAYDKCN